MMPRVRFPTAENDCSLAEFHGTTASNLDGGPALRADTAVDDFELSSVEGRSWRGGGE